MKAPGVFSMDISTRLASSVLGFLVAVLLGACGGGGGGGGGDAAAPAPPPVPAILGTRASASGGYLARFDLPSGPASKVIGRGLPGYSSVAALAFDSSSGTLYAFDRGSDVLLTLDPVTGAPTEIGPTGIGDIAGLAFDSSTGTLYGVTGLRLLMLDPMTGAASVVGSMSLSSGPSSLAFYPPTGVLFTVASNTGDLYSIDPLTADATLVGNVGAATDIVGLAYNSDTAMLNGSDIATDEIVAIDPTNATPTVLGPSGFCCVFGLAFDPGSATVFAAESADSRLMTVDAFGAATPIGSVGFPSVGLITWDTVSDVLYGIDGRIRHLVRIDRTTGEATDIGPTGFDVIHGLAHDPNSDTLYGIFSFVGNHRLLELDQGTGAATSLGDITGIPGPSFGDLAFDPDTDTLYATNLASGTAELVTINPATREATAVNTIGFADVRGLGFDPGGGVLYGLETTTDELLVIDTAPGADPSGTVVGPVGFNVGWGLSIDPQSGGLLGSDVVNGSDLLSIDPATGNGFAVGSFAYSFVQGLAFDRDTRTVYGVHNDMLLTIDPATGRVDAIGPTGNFLRGLAYDPNLGILYGVDIASTLFTIDTATGTATDVGAVGAVGIASLAFDPSANALYGADSSTLYIIDPTTGAGTPAGVGGGSLGISPIGGLAFDYDTNTLYASTTSPYELYTIDPAVPTATLVGSSGYRMDGLTYAVVP